MAHTLDEINALFANLRVEWDASEKLVKSAEQVCGDAVIPSIKEFRYAGRRLVDAFHALAETGDLNKANDFVQDAIFNCHCARHDAIDVATGIMASNMDVAVQKIGYVHILAAFPNFAELRRSLNEVRDKIRISRGKRSDRDAIYLTVHDTDFPGLLRLYDDYNAAEDLMKALARNSRLEILFSRTATALSILVAIAAVLVAVFKKSDCPPYVLKPQRLQGSPSNAAHPSSRPSVP